MKKRVHKTVQIPKAKILRAVASSTAIETGETVQSIEAKLKQKSDKLKGLSLAL